MSDDLSSTIAEASADTVKAAKAAKKSKPRKSVDYRIVRPAILVLFLGWLFINFHEELVSTVSPADPEVIDQGSKAMLGEAAVSVEDYFRQHGQLPETLPDELIRNLVDYRITGDHDYELTLTFNGVVTRNLYTVQAHVIER